MKNTFLDERIRQLIRIRAVALEAQYRFFIQRTGLKPSEVVLVKFKGRFFIQWIGAVPKMHMDVYESEKVMQKPITTCCQFHNTGGSKEFRCGPQSADRTAYRLNKAQTEKLCQRITEPLMGFELSRADAEAILDRMRIELERRIR